MSLCFSLHIGTEVRTSRDAQQTSGRYLGSKQGERIPEWKAQVQRLDWVNQFITIADKTMWRKVAATAGPGDRM